MRTSKRTYALGLIAPIAQALMFATEQWASTNGAWSRWVATWRMDLLWIAAVAFTLGLLIQDRHNPDSWLRTAWRDWNRLFTVPLLEMFPSTDPLDSSQKLVVGVKAARRIPDAEIVLIAVMFNNGVFSDTYVFRKLIDQHLAAGEQRDLTLATIPAEPIHMATQQVHTKPMHFGDDPANAVIPPNASVWLKIEMLGLGRKQSFLVHFKAPWGQSLGAIHSYSFSREDQNPFDGIRFPYPRI
ncbi:MAG TPA: hypothetical protein VG841_04725 [Caulobacterales bacterium]|nr:hypothetical protein [Caulobacterales bacterium]